MIHSRLRFRKIDLSVVLRRQRRQSSCRRRKQSSLAVQSLEPRLALTVGIGADVSEATLLQTDVTAPEIRSVVAPKAGVYGEGRRLAFRVNFTEPVIATGTPTLPVTIGDTVRQAAWNGKGSGSKSLVFTAMVEAGDAAPTGVQVAGPITFPDGATIRDKAGNELAPAASGVFPKARVDAVGPSVTEFSPATIAGKRVSLQVTFAEPVIVRGKPTIPFMLDGVPEQLVYARGSGRNVLTFRYKAEKQETPTVDTVVIPAQAISLGSSRIIDRGRNAAISLAGPTDVDLSVASVAENASPGAVVGVLSTVDGDGDRDRHTYTLVSGLGDTDNGSFTIVGGTLKTAASFDFEAKSLHSVRVRSTDQGGQAFEKQFTISVTDALVEMAFVPVWDAGNQADSTGYGAVDYQYRIGTYEVTIGQYTAFLNAVAADDPHGLYDANMTTDLNSAGISRSGSPGSYTYSVIGPAGATPAGADSATDRPITYVSWFDAARFANWMHNGATAGADTETGAYTLVASPLPLPQEKNAGAQYYIPTENEWYKAAYYKGGGTNAGYWVYATQSDTAPGNMIGSGANQANYWAGDFAVTQSDVSRSQNLLTNVGAFSRSVSAYGTFDQTGNVYEWNDLDGSDLVYNDRLYRGIRGGAYGINTNDISASDRMDFENPSVETPWYGFRLASPV